MWLCGFVYRVDRMKKLWKIRHSVKSTKYNRERNKGPIQIFAISTLQTMHLQQLKSKHKKSKGRKRYSHNFVKTILLGQFQQYQHRYGYNNTNNEVLVSEKSVQPAKYVEQSYGINGISL